MIKKIPTRPAKNISTTQCTPADIQLDKKAFIPLPCTPMPPTTKIIASNKSNTKEITPTTLRIFCLKCQEEWNHVECKPFSHYEYEDFLIEKEYKNFDENGNRKMKYGELRSLIHNGKI